MSRRNDGGSAFPTPWENGGDLNATAPDGQLVPPGATAFMPGMSLRDYFAAECLDSAERAVAAEARHIGVGNEHITPQRIAKAAYRLADALLAAREGGA